MPRLWLPTCAGLGAGLTNAEDVLCGSFSASSAKQNAAGTLNLVNRLFYNASKEMQRAEDLLAASPETLPKLQEIEKLLVRRHLGVL